MSSENTYPLIISIVRHFNTGDRPIKVLAEDGNQYLLKHNLSNSLRLNVIKEWVCYTLFKHFKVSIPDARLLLFDPWALRDDLTTYTGRYVPHTAFGSTWIESFEIKDDFYQDSPSSKFNIENPGDIAKILVMDIWLKNNDRNLGNLNLIQHQNSIFAIDHAATFDHLDFIRLTDEEVLKSFDDSGDIGALLTNSYFFTLYYGKYKSIIEDSGRELCSRILQTERSLYEEILSDFPLDWTVTEKELQAIITFLDFRKEKLLEVFEGHLDFNRSHS